MESQKVPKAKAILNNKNKAGGITTPVFIVYYKSRITKTVWQWNKNRHINQRNRLESPEIESLVYGQLIFHIGAKNPQQRKDSLFKEWCWEDWVSTNRRIKLDCYFTAYTKINPKWIKSSNIRLESVGKLQGENSHVDNGRGNVSMVAVGIRNFCMFLSIFLTFSKNKILKKIYCLWSRQCVFFWI